MRSSTEPARALAEAALVEKIEALSFLRSLNDRLAAAPDYATACQALVEHVWEEGRADTVGYLSVDVAQRRARLEAVAPVGAPLEAVTEVPFDAPPVRLLLEEAEPLVLLDPPSWLLPRRGPIPAGRGVVVGAATQLRGTTRGLLLAFYARGAVANLEEDRRILAIVATTAALALDAARSPAREEFVAALRHDIANPLDAALGHCEMLLERLRATADDQAHDEAHDEAVSLAGSVLASLTVVADLVSNSLQMTAIERAAPSLQIERVELASLAARVAARFRPAAGEKGVRIVCRGGPAIVAADRRQLGRVITNLLSNAVKYTPGPGEVTVTVASEAAHVTLAIADPGYGLVREDVARLFVRYARFHRDRGIPGSGLGLYSSRGIVEAHGGTIEVASEPGHGSTFTVRLPAPD
jgi:signal transduction histidine kinase